MSLDELRSTLAAHFDAAPTNTWPAETLQAMISVLKLTGVRPVKPVGKARLTVVQGGA